MFVCHYSFYGNYQPHYQHIDIFFKYHNNFYDDEYQIIKQFNNLMYTYLVIC